MHRSELSGLRKIASVLCCGLVLFLIQCNYPRRNHAKIVRLLRSACADTLDSRITRVLLADGTVLHGERKSITCGYKLVLHVLSAGFTIEATPVEYGKTGLISFFRDDTGRIRYEFGDKKATQRSPEVGRTMDWTSQPATSE